VINLLDTTVVSELRKPRARADTGVHAWAGAQRTSDPWLSVITVKEVEIGVARIERRDERQGAELRRWLDRDPLSAFEGRLLPIDSPSLAAPLASTCRTQAMRVT